MSLRMVRQPYEDISNIDDITPFRYAYGGQNGYVKNKGLELGYSVDGTKFTVGSGRVVLDGVESDVDASGVDINVDLVAETRYYVIYYNVNLALNTTAILSQFDTNSYPTISSGDDLTQNPSGTANLVLYKFEANNGVISNVQKVVQEIEYSGRALSDYDISKGTVEERLTALGFKEGVLTDIPSGSTSYIKQLGKMVIGHIEFPRSSSGYIYKGTRIGGIPNDFLKPSINTEINFYFKDRVYCTISIDGHSYQGEFCGSLQCEIYTYGSISAKNLRGMLYTGSSIITVDEEISSFAVRPMKAGCDFGYVLS